MPSVAQQISGINRTKLAEKNNSHDLTCSCRNTPCPLGGKCNVKENVYQAEIKDTEGETYTYIGMTAESFRKRYSKHAQSFRNHKYAQETKLSKKVWSIKESGGLWEGTFYKIAKF